jgi:hypothetical protein
MLSARRFAKEQFMGLGPVPNLADNGGARILSLKNRSLAQKIFSQGP